MKASVPRLHPLDANFPAAYCVESYRAMDMRPKTPPPTESAQCRKAQTLSPPYPPPPPPAVANRAPPYAPQIPAASESDTAQHTAAMRCSTSMFHPCKDHASRHTRFDRHEFDRKAI